MSRKKGFKHSEETKKNIGIGNAGTIRLDLSKRQRGKNNVAKRLEVRKKISKNRKGKGLGENNCNNRLEIRTKKRNTLLKFYKDNPEVKVQKSLLVLERYRENPDLKVQQRINRLNQIFKNGFNISIGKNEKKILDEIALSLGYKIIRQFLVSGYSVDGYIPKINLVIEVDEKQHFTYNNNLKQKDIDRQKVIQDELNCTFVRIPDI